MCRSIFPAVRRAGIAILSVGLCLSGCTDPMTVPTERKRGEPFAVANPVFHFEIPVADMDRAIRFYELVFGFQLSRRTVDTYDMAFFPRTDGAPGASGALAKGDVYVPSKAGSIIYFDVPDIDPVVARAEALGARVLYPKTHTGEAGYVAEIEDSEGNRIALSAVAD